MSRKPPVRDVDEDDLEVDERRARRRRPDGGRGDHEARRGADGRPPHGARPCAGSTRSTASTARAAPGRTPTRSTGTPPSSARTAPRRSPRRRPCATSTGASSPRTRWRTWPTRPTTGSASRAGSPSRWCCGPGGTHYEPIAWDDAFAMVAGHLRGLASPDEAVFYTSGQDLQRGGVRLPAVRPRLRHQQPARLLEHVPRVHVGRARRDHRHRQGLGLARGRAPRRADRRSSARTPAPTTRGCCPRSRRRRRTAPGSSRSTRCARPGWCGSRTRRRRAAGSGAAPRWPTCTCRSGSTATSRCSRRSARCCSSGTPSTTTSSPNAHDRLRASGPPTSPTLDWDVVDRATGLTRERDRGDRARCSATPRRRSSAGRWASPSTATRSPRSRSSSTSRCCRATSASPGAGLCPVRGHSNVQGDRTMGIWERPKPAFLDALRREFGFDPPREPGFDTVEAIRALRDGRARVFFAMGGNFVSAVLRHRRHRGRDARGPTSPCTSRPSSTGRTSSPAARR